ncbi:MAG: winged helix DNA-binding domain-containing protein [Solirubrobacteraceae bacterium]
MARAAKLTSHARRARLTSQLLTGEQGSDPVGVTRHLLAVQGQDPQGARLAIRARSNGLSGADVDRALSEERSLLITWVNRGTLHLLAREDYPWLHALTTPPLHKGNARRLAQEGVSPLAAEKAVAAIERALASEGPLTRVQLRERVAAAGVRTEGQALVHLLMLASLRGLIVRGPMVDGQHAHVLVRDWLDESVGVVDRGSALAELARRYLRGHGPADDRDLARWAGLPLRDVRAGLASISRELHERPDGLVELRDAPAPARVPPPRLLGAFDPLLLGWCSREDVLGEHRQIVTVNGLFRPFALVAGRAEATWTLAARKLELHPFAPLSKRVEQALERDGKDVLRFLGRSS